MLDFLLNSILNKKPDVARFALKLEDCQDASKLDLKILEDMLKAFGEQQALIDSVIEEKQKGLEDDRNLLMPLMLRDEAGDVTPEETKQIEALMARTEYQELFVNKFGDFKQEMDGKVDFARAEFEQLSARADKLLK